MRALLKHGARLLLILIAVILLLVGSFFVGGIRAVYLKIGVVRAVRALPGEVTGDWSWPRANRIEGRNIVWVGPHGDEAAGDTLAVVSSLSCQLDLRALVDHDLKIQEVRAHIAFWDIPGTMTALGPAAKTKPQHESGHAMVYLRQGGIPGLPSLGVERLEAQADHLILPAGVVVEDVQLEGGASLYPGEHPRLVIKALQGKAQATTSPGWSLELAHLQGALGYDPPTRTVQLDSLNADLPMAAFWNDSLQVRAGPLKVACAGSVRDSTVDVATTLQFVTEVPARLQSPIPDLKFRSLQGRLKVRATGALSNLTLAGVLDLDPTPDLRMGHVVGSALVRAGPPAALQSVKLDSLALQWRKTHLAASGTWDGTNINGRLKADLQNFELPKLFLPVWANGLTGNLRAEGRVDGPVLSPHMNGTVAAACNIDSLWALPGVAAATASLPAGLDRGEFRRVKADLKAGLDGTLQNLEVDLRLDLKRTPWLDRGLFAGHLGADSRAARLQTMHVDTLAVSLLGGQVVAAGSWDSTGIQLRATVGLDGTELLTRTVARDFSGMDLGAHGTLQVAGPLTALEGSAQVQGHAESKDFTVPDFRVEVSRSHDAVQARARLLHYVRLGRANLDSLRVNWQGEAGPSPLAATGSFDLNAWAPRAAGWLRGKTAGDSLRTLAIDTLVFTAGGTTLHSAGPITLVRGPGPDDVDLQGLRIIGDLGHIDVGVKSGKGTLQANASADLLLTSEWLDTVFPSPFWSAGGGTDMGIKGAAEFSQAPVAGQTVSPVLHGSTAIRLVPRNQDPPARVDGSFRLAGGDTAALSAVVNLSVGETALLHGQARWPGRIDPTDGSWRPAGGLAGGIHIPEQDLPLDFINRFLPSEVVLKGALTVGADLEAGKSDSVSTTVLEDMPLTGLVRTAGLQVSLPNQSRLEVKGRLGLAGKVIDPRLEGTITVTSALIKLPDIQRALHPITGKSALWDADRPAAADTTAGGREPRWRGPDNLESPPPLYMPDLDVRVVVPGNVHVTGYGLQAEFAGEVNVGRGWDDQGYPVPVLRGQIHTVEGELRAMNRIFEVERGEFSFEGHIPVNPRVDILMSAEVEGTTVQIKITGTALKPNIVLTSQPEMIQADIMAVLVFGHPLNELDADQQGNLGSQETLASQLRRNLQDLALVFGSAGIQNQVSSRVGLDQVQVGAGPGGSALVLGKYLNPRMLIKYHLSLERSGTYFMTLEYTLNRLLKLISTYGQGEEASGLELRWQRRY